MQISHDVYQPVPHDAKDHCCE